MAESRIRDLGPPTVPTMTIGSSPDLWNRWARRVREEALDAEHMRVATGLNDVVVRRLFALGLSLESALGRHPELEQALRPLIAQTDEIIRATRDVAFGPRRGVEDGPRACS